MTAKLAPCLFCQAQIIPRIFLLGNGRVQTKTKRKALFFGAYNGILFFESKLCLLGLAMCLQALFIPKSRPMDAADLPGYLAAAERA